MAKPKHQQQQQAPWGEAFPPAALCVCRPWAEPRDTRKGEAAKRRAWGWRHTEAGQQGVSDLESKAREQRPGTGLQHHGGTCSAGWTLWGIEQRHSEVLPVLLVSCISCTPVSLSRRPLTTWRPSPQRSRRQKKKLSHFKDPGPCR